MGYHIYVYSPSGAVRDKPAFRRGLAWLKARGHTLEIDPCALAGWQRFAGDDETRLSAIHRAMASGADLALMTRGGYGLTRILARVDFSGLAQAIQNGMKFVGFSDFTALQSALLAKTGAITWAGPALCEGFGADAPDEIMQACFDDMLTGSAEGCGWRQLPVPKSGTDLPSMTNAAIPVDGVVARDAILWGGNLSVLTGLLGTPFFPDIQSGVLFLEDVGEHPYRIERMLTQLLLSGVLARQQAVLLGQFTDFKLTSHDRGYTLKSVIAALRQRLPIPVLTNLPFGHVQTKVLLPVGARVDLQVQGREAMLFWGHV